MIVSFDFFILSFKVLDLWGGKKRTIFQFCVLVIVISAGILCEQGLLPT